MAPIAAKVLSALVVFLMLLEFVGAAVTSLPRQSHGPSFHAKRTSSSMLEASLFEKAEEESEKSEEKKDGTDRALLVDFSFVAQSLLVQFNPKVKISSFAYHYDVGPPVYALNCVFQI